MGATAVKAGPEERGRTIASALGGRSVVLVGMMGAGKTAVGRRLAARLGFPFRDADAEIEAAAQKSIPEIFETDGEPFFRDKERRVVARLLAEQSPIVLATGGGAYMHPQTREAVRATAVSIWLKADLDVLIRRVRRKANRPLLKTPDPEKTLRSLMEARYPFYAMADVTVLSRDVPQDIVLDAVMTALERHLAGALP
jgi:shikimate kinase